MTVVCHNHLTKSRENFKILCKLRRWSVVNSYRSQTVQFLVRYSGVVPSRHWTSGAYLFAVSCNNDVIVSLTTSAIARMLVRPPVALLRSPCVGRRHGLSCQSWDLHVDHWQRDFSPRTVFCVDRCHCPV